MPQSVATEIAGRSLTLFEKLGQNNDLANVIMGFLGRITLMCHKMGKPIQGVDAGPVNESNGEFRFALSFNDLLITPMGLWGPQGDILTYARSRSVHLGKVLERNAKLMRTFTNLVETIEKYCERQGKPFKNFQVAKAFIHQKTNVCVIKSGPQQLPHGRFFR